MVPNLSSAVARQTTHWIKLQALLSRLEELLRDGLIVAYSGGVDSSFLLWAATEALEREGSGRLLALTAVSV